MENHSLHDVKWVLNCTGLDGKVLFARNGFMIHHANAVFESMVGLPIEKLRGMTVTDFMTEDGDNGEIGGANAFIALLEGEGTDWSGELEGQRVDSSTFKMEVKVSEAILDNETYYIGTFRDITERIKAQERLEKSLRDIKDREWGLKKTNDNIKLLYKELEHKNADLQKLDDMKSEFVATVSHELRTPLTIIRQGVNLIRDKIIGDVNEEQFELLCDVSSNVDRLARIINDLLDMSSLESGKMHLKKNRVDTKDLLSRIVNEFKIKAESKKVKVAAKVEDNTPAILGDEQRLLQALVNLVGNAMKFSPEGGLITVRAEEIKNMVKISVTDEGKGISKEDLPKLFGKFHQFGRLEGPGDRGTGIGLNITKSIVEQHKGKVGVTSEIDKGSTFYFTVPKYLSHEAMSGQVLGEEIRVVQQVSKDHMLSIILARVENFNDLEPKYGKDSMIEIMKSLFKGIDKTVVRKMDRLIQSRRDEILIILPETDLKGATLVKDRIKESLKTKPIEHRGEKVELKLDLSLAEYPDDGPDASHLIEVARARAGRIKKVLIVDDHPQIVRILNYTIKSRSDCECISAADGFEALEKARRDKPDVIICDVMMPKMNGYEVVGRLKEDKQTQNIPIIMLTAHQPDSRKIESLLPGSVPVVSKSDGFEELIELLHKTEIIHSSMSNGKGNEQ